MDSVLVLTRRVDVVAMGVVGDVGLAAMARGCLIRHSATILAA